MAFMKKTPRGFTRQAVRAAKARKAEKRARARVRRARLVERRSGGMSRAAAVERWQQTKSDKERALDILAAKEQNLGEVRTDRDALLERLVKRDDEIKRLTARLWILNLTSWVGVVVSVVLVTTVVYLLAR